MSTPWTLASESPRIGGTGTLALVEGSTFVVSAPGGDIHPDQPQGLFVRDTRVLSTFRVTVDGTPLEPVSAVVRGPFSMTVVTRAHHPHQADPLVTVLRHRHVGRGLHEDLELRNHTIEKVDLVLAMTVDADFASLFDVKAAAQDPDRRGLVRATGVGFDLLDPAGVGTRATHVRLDPAPSRIEGWTAAWEISLAPGEHQRVCVEMAVSIGGDLLEPTWRCDAPPTESLPVTRLSRWHSSIARFACSDGRLERASEQALTDLGVLRIFDPEHADRVVVAAGAPWFMALFGRDSIITAWMALIADHQLARGVLLALADGQGRQEVEATEEQPGRILHEVRYDIRSTGLLDGSNVYYGTVDATPLFVMLAAEYLRWSGDRALIDQLLPSIDRALEWMATYGDRQGDGFISYLRTREHGLANQGWKDSWDGIRYGTGRVAAAPLALAEVQAYAYAAYESRAYLADVVGDSATGDTYRVKAADLRRRFDERFWLDERATYAVALDGEGRPVDSSTSNVGHCLWTGIVPPGRSAQLAAELGSPDLFSGYGLRTLSAANPGFNPLSYHCGSVWPHDTAIAIAGLHRYGHHDVAAKLTSGLLDAAVAQGGRLPELFGGFARQELPSPVPYPASCSPQAWAAAAPLLIVRSLLGLEPDLPAGTIRLRADRAGRPELLRAIGVPLGSRRLEVVADRTGVHVLGDMAGLSAIVS